MRRPARFSRQICTFSAAAAITLLATGCSFDLETDPTPTAGPTAVVFGPDDVGVGTLLDRSAEAWTSVEGWSAEARVEQLDASESGAGSSVTVEEVLLPSTRRVLHTNEDTIVSEEIAIDGRIYMRGTLVPASIYPGADATTWIVFAPEAVPADTPLAQRVEYLTSAPEFPFADVTGATRLLPASPVGDIQVNERTCSVYQFSTEEDASVGITYRIAFDADWLPCQLVKEGGGVVETTTWSYGTSEISIEAPDDVQPVDAFPTRPSS